jgi:hypothetical protein
MCKKCHHSFARIIFCVYLQPAKSVFKYNKWLKSRLLT